MVTVHLSVDELLRRQARKQRLLEQARLLSEAYDAGQLREMLDKLRQDNLSDSQQPQQLTMSERIKNQ